MNKVLTAGRIIFVLGITGLAILCIIYKDFIVGRPPAWPANFNPDPFLGYLSAFLLISCAMLIISKKYAPQASLLVAFLIFLFSICRHIPHFMESWANAYKSIALFGGCLVIAVAGSYDQNSRLPALLQRNSLIIAGSVLLAAFLLVGGYAHFKYADFVNTLIPDYIPFHPFWTYFCGGCLIAGGIGLLIPALRSIAAILIAIMISGWFLLLHIPRFLANTHDTSDRLGLCESFTFCGIFFVLYALTHKKNTAEAHLQP